MLTVVLEDIFKPHNASAVLRTVECLGLQDVHVVEQENEFVFNPYVLRGSGKWLSIHHYQKSPNKNNIELCLTQLKHNGYQVLATSPHDYAEDYNEVEIGQKTAIVFGAEEQGISEYVKKNADGFIKIPMMGFTESFNISVSAAIILENFNRKIRSKLEWNLTSNELFELKMEWMKKVVPNIEAHLREFDRQFSQKTNQTK